jgi:hypothetical protein
VKEEHCLPPPLEVPVIILRMDNFCCKCSRVCVIVIIYLLWAKSVRRKGRSCNRFMLITNIKYVSTRPLWPVNFFCYSSLELLSASSLIDSYSAC